MAAGLVLVAVALAATATPAAAGGFGISPRLGVAYAQGGDGDDTVSLSVGGQLVYSFNEYLGVGAGYTRFVSIDPEDAPDLNLVDLRAIVQVPLGPVTPYATAGPGYHWNDESGAAHRDGLLFDAGAGVHLDLILAGANAGVLYRALEDGTDRVEVVAGVSVGLF